MASACLVANPTDCVHPNQRAPLGFDVAAFGNNFLLLQVPNLGSQSPTGNHKTRQLAWWFAWVGMDPARFLTLDRPAGSQLPAIGEWLRSVSLTVFGTALFSVGIFLIRKQFDYLAAWCGMFGLVLMLHFGLFQLLSCAWRTIGVNAQPIMNRPLSSVSIGEFWGRRWNRAFRDASYAALFVPIARRWGAATATWAVFIFSGLVHDLAVSVPAKGGYGLPTLYFLLQGITVLLENSALGKRWRLGRGRWGHAMTLVILFVPLPILFHPLFVRGVIVPFMQWTANI